MAAPIAVSRTSSNPPAYVSLPPLQVAPGATTRAVVKASPRGDPSVLVPQLQAMFKDVKMDGDVQAALDNLCTAIEAQAKPKPKPPATTCCTYCSEFFTLFVVVPVLVLVSNAAFGEVLAAIENWPFTTGFEYVIAITCGLANPIGASGNASPTTQIGQFVSGMIGLQCIALVGIIGGWASNLRIVTKPFDFLSGLICCFPKGSATQKLVSTLVLVFLIAPVLTCIFVLIFGSVMAAIEGWPILEGFFYLLADVGGLPNPLTNDSPATVTGGVTDVLISTWIFVISSTIIGIASGAELPSCGDCWKENCGEEDEDEEEEGLLQ